MVGLLEGAEKLHSNEHGRIPKQFLSTFGCCFRPVSSSRFSGKSLERLQSTSLFFFASITVSEKVAVKYVVYCTAGCNQDFVWRLCSMYTCKHESWGAECRRAQCMGLLNLDELWKYLHNAFRMIVGGKLWMWTFCINGQNQHAAYIDLETASRISELFSISAGSSISYLSCLQEQIRAVLYNLEKEAESTASKDWGPLCN